MKVIKFIHFHNNTDLPIIISSWVDNSISINSLRVNPQEKLIIHSSVGEWHLHSMFESLEDRNIWEEKGLNKYLTIGKFRSTPCYSGDYYWGEYNNIFECKYNKIEKNDLFHSEKEDFSQELNVDGLITFSQI
jgi:hypothetical protein